MITNKNDELIVSLPNEKASVNFAARLALRLNPALVLTFSGDLGAGKTTLIRAMLRHLGIQSTIKSPTYSLLESYECNTVFIHHFDLYRIQHEDELDYLGFRDYFTQESICLIEWAENAGKMLPKADISFKFYIKGAGRELHITAWSTSGKRILALLTGE